MVWLQTTLGAYHLAEFTRSASNRAVNLRIPIHRTRWKRAEGLELVLKSKWKRQFRTAFQHFVYFRCYPVGQDKIIFSFLAVSPTEISLDFLFSVTSVCSCYVTHSLSKTARKT